MAEFLTTNAISFYIEKVIKESQSELYLLMPYLQLSREFYDAVKGSSERGVSIIIVYANEDLYTEEKLKLGELENLEIYCMENLNAKCCCSEDNVLITSMDIHQLSAIDSAEMGIIFNKNSDNNLYKQTYNEIKTIITSSKNMNLHRKTADQIAVSSVKSKKIYHGFCINCAMPISYNPGNPYCRSCSPKGDNKPVKFDQGKFCHICGLQASLKIDSPLCDRCNNGPQFKS